MTEKYEHVYCQNIFLMKNVPDDETFIKQFFADMNVTPTHYFHIRNYKTKDHTNELFLRVKDRADSRRVQEGTAPHMKWKLTNPVNKNPIELEFFSTRNRTDHLRASKIKDDEWCKIKNLPPSYTEDDVEKFIGILLILIFYL